MSRRQRIANTVAVGFVQERERVIANSKKPSANSPLRSCRFASGSHPAYHRRHDPQRARQLTEQLLRRYPHQPAKVVVIDITGVAAMDVTLPTTGSDR